jgi:hypothetical protein
VGPSVGSPPDGARPTSFSNLRVASAFGSGVPHSGLALLGLGSSAIGTPLS